jgi:biopolymer transport protein ExbD
MKRIVFILALALFSFNSYAQSNYPKTQTTNIDKTQYLQVFVNAKGKLFVDGKKMSLKNLDKKLAVLSKNNGYIQLAREGGYNSKVAATNKKVVELFRKHGRMVKTYTDKTFTKEILL